MSDWTTFRLDAAAAAPNLNRLNRPARFRKSSSLKFQLNRREATDRPLNGSRTHCGRASRRIARGKRFSEASVTASSGFAALQFTGNQLRRRLASVHFFRLARRHRRRRRRLGDGGRILGHGVARRRRQDGPARARAKWVR